MTTSVGTLEARVTANTTGLKVGLKRATAQIRDFSTKSRGYLKANAAQIGQIGRKFMMAGAAIGGGLVMAVKQFGQFDQAMRKATAVSDVTEEQFAKMSKMAEKMSKKLGVSANSTAQAFYFLGSAGLSAQQQIAAFPAVTTLAKAAVIDMGTAAEMVVDTMKGFKIPFTDTTRVTDVLTEAVTSADMNFGQLGEAMSYVAGIARATNNSLEETAAVLGIMANEGIKGSMAGTSLRRALLNLAAPTDAVNKALDTLGRDGSSADKAKKAMKDLGIQIYGSDGKMRSITKIMGDLIPALSNVSEQTRNMALKQLFGARAVTGMLAVVNKGTEGLKKITEQLKNSGGAAERVARKQLAALNEKFKILGGHIADVSRDIGEVLAPTVAKLIAKIQKLVDWFGELSPGVKKAIVLFAAFVGTGALAGGGALAVAAAIALVGGSMIGLSAAIAGIVIAIGGLITLIVALRKNWGHITDRIAYYTNYLWSEIKEKFGKIGVIVRETMKRVAHPLNIKAWKTLKEGIKKETDEITKNAKEFRKNLTEIYTSTVFAPEPLGKGKTKPKSTGESTTGGAGGGGVVTPLKVDTGLAAWKDAYKKATLSEYKYEIYLLEKRRDEFKKEGRDEVKVKKWFAIEKGKIDEEYIEKGRRIANAKEDEEMRQLRKEIEMSESLVKEKEGLWKQHYERLLEFREMDLDDVINSIQRQLKEEQLGMEERMALVKLLADYQDQNRLKDIRKSIQAANQVKNSIVSNFSEVIMGTKKFGEAWKNIWNSFVQIIIKEVLEKLVAKLLEVIALEKMLQVAFAFVGLKGGGITKGKVPKGQTGLITKGIGMGDTIPAMLRPNEVVMPLEKLPSLIPKITNPAPSEIIVNFNQYGDIKTDVDYEILKADLAGTIQDAIRGS